jgi:hypothetical protein
METSEAKQNFLQESSASTEWKKWILKSETGRGLYVTEPYVGLSHCLRTCGTKLKANCEAAVRALNFVPHSSSVRECALRASFCTPKVRNRFNNASVQRKTCICISQRLASKVAAGLSNVFYCE